ncbi:mCG1049520 [Mus musculus]|nr:mCG1049520 [Mus musculus]
MESLRTAHGVARVWQSLASWNHRISSICSTSPQRAHSNHLSSWSVTT